MKAAKLMMIGAGLEGHTWTHVQPLPSTNFLGPWLGSCLMSGPCISNFGSFDDVSWCFNHPVLFISHTVVNACLEPLPKDELSPSLSCQIDKIFRTLKAGDGLSGSEKVCLEKCKLRGCDFKSNLRSASIWTILDSGTRPVWDNNACTHAQEYELWFCLTVSTPWRTMCVHSKHVFGQVSLIISRERAHTHSNYSNRHKVGT